jgi:hypothetical protein
MEKRQTRTVSGNQDLTGSGSEGKTRAHTDLDEFTQWWLFSKAGKKAQGRGVSTTVDSPQLSGEQSSGLEQ